MDTLNLRTVKREEVGGALTVVDFRDLKKGDKFRLYESDGVEPKPEDENGKALYLALEDAVPLEGPAYAGVEAELSLEAACI